MKELISPEQFEKDLYKIEAKKLISNYKDFQKTIIPSLNSYASITPIKSQKDVMKGVIYGCEMLYKALTEYCEGKMWLSLDELKMKVKNFEKSMDMLQKKYIKIVTEELPNDEDDFRKEV